jgi:two-component system, cell cycle sensor histidine kinase and response regulator CckA
VTDSRIASKSPAGEGRRGTVLVVDDEPAMLRLLRLVLGGAGFTVIEAHGAAHAVELAARHTGPIHLLLTDANLTPGSGRELAQRLLVARPAMRVLYMSTDFPTDLGPKDPPAGMEFVTKPLGVSALVRRVRELVLADAAAEPGPRFRAPDDTKK